MKSLYIVISLALLYLFIGNQNSKEIIIPESSIRFRVIANSNDEYDQLIKLEVKENLERLISTLLINAKDINETKLILKNNITNLNNNVKGTLISKDYLKPFNISFGKNYFPEKELYGVKYKSGEYESLVVTIGEGLGNNWWCVLFPPLCLIEAEESTEVEYRLYVKEILDKYI